MSPICCHGTDGCEGKGEKHACASISCGMYCDPDVPAHHPACLHGRTRSVVPGAMNAWEILQRDCDEWKKRAIAAEKKAAELERIAVEHRQKRIAATVKASEACSAAETRNETIALLRQQNATLDGLLRKRIRASDDVIIQIVDRLNKLEGKQGCP